MRIVYVSYPDSERAPGVPAAADHALGLREWLTEQDHALVATSDTGSLREQATLGVRYARLDDPLVTSVS